MVVPVRRGAMAIASSARHRLGTVSKLCNDIDKRVHAFRKRPLAGDWRPYLWFGAT